MNEKKRTTWYIFVRLIVVSLFLVFTVILNIKYPAGVDSETSSGLVRLLVATYTFSLFSIFALRYQRLLSALVYAQIIWDLLLVTLLILFTGGITSPYSFLYLICIVSASVLLSRRQAFYTASLCAILYGALLDLQYYAKLMDLGLSPIPARQLGAQYILYTIFLNILAFCLTAFLTGYLAERTRVSERALFDKVIDYQELDRLNSSIVANLNSGLLTLNNEGRIRVFNQYAESLTGFTQAEAYNRLFGEVFPDVNYDRGPIDDINRGEFEYRSRHNGKMIIGFKSVPLFDTNGEQSGLIIIFQDLTQLKMMEEELKKADRLSAIGQLAAHMAHEIRNPLASISGSVQLIAQGDAIGAKDKKLMEIVVRETDRLNKLIKDFLEYARPVKPVTKLVRLHELLRTVEMLVSKDPHFENTDIEIFCRNDICVMGDYDHLEQVFWNLMTNSTEAMPDGGKITILVTEAKPAKVRITVADTGCGMDREEVERVFEPFFTSKKDGTGLGLATVYRIIEANSGTIAVNSVKGKGTEFTIYLPVAAPEMLLSRSY